MVSRARERCRGLRPHEAGAGRPVLVEFVSANPTGPMHVGHVRGAVVGGAGAYLGLNYYDHAGDRITWTDTKQKAVGGGDWTRLVETFIVPTGCVRVDLALVLHGHGSAFFDRVQVEVGEAATQWAPREAAARPEHTGGVPRVAILKDDIPASGTPSAPETLAATLQGSYDCSFLTADEFDQWVVPEEMTRPSAG